MSRPAMPLILLLHGFQVLVRLAATDRAARGGVSVVAPDTLATTCHRSQGFEAYASTCSPPISAL